MKKYFFVLLPIASCSVLSKSNVNDTGLNEVSNGVNNPPNDPNKSKEILRLLKSLLCMKGCPSREDRENQVTVALNFIKNSDEYINRDPKLKEDCVRQAIYASSDLPTLPIIKHLLSGNKPEIKFVNLAIKEGCKDIVKYLIQRCIDLNEKDDLGETPAHHALVRGVPYILQLVLDAGVSVDAKNNQGVGLFLKLILGCNDDYAKIPLADLLEMADLLRQYGANVNETYNEEQTVADIIVEMRLSQLLEPTSTEHRRCSYTKTVKMIEWLSNHGGRISNKDEVIRLIDKVIDIEKKSLNDVDCKLNNVLKELNDEGNNLLRDLSEKAKSDLSAEKDAIETRIKCLLNMKQFSR